MTLQQIYRGLPAPLQNLACSAYGYRLIRRRYGAAYDSLEREIISRDRWSHAQIRDFSAQRLQHTVSHAVATVPYYSQMFAALKLDPRDIRCVDELRFLPILEKRTVQQNLGAFRSDPLADAGCTTVHTSGTTGTGLVFPMTLEAEREQWATCWRYRSRLGISHQTWYAHFFGKSVVPYEQSRPPFWRVNSPGRQVLFSGYHMNDEFLPYYVHELNRRRLPWIHGYPSLLSVLANYLLQRGTALDYKPAIVTVASESLLDHQKVAIERALQAPCRQHYGMTEAVGNISECPLGRLHVDEDFGHLEFVPIGQDRHRIIATGYANLAFPLIRYDTGDVVELGPEHVSPCPCGLPGRLVRGIDGRIEDYVLTPDGRKIGRLDHMFKDMVNIRECQVYQYRNGTVVFRIVRGDNYRAKDERILHDEARVRLGSGLQIAFDYVTQIPRTKRGKLRFVISELASARIRGGSEAGAYSSKRTS